jgi:hypothetical protein
MLTTASEHHLRTQRGELLARYDTLTKRIAALDTDIGRELDSERQLVLRERRADLVAERDQIATDIARIEQQLAEINPAPLPNSLPTAAPDTPPHPGLAKLNGKQIAQLQQAILDALVDYDELRQFVRIRLDRYLAQISLGPNLTAVVFDVISRAEREGWTAELLDALAGERPNRSDIQELCRTLRAALLSPAPQTPETDQAALSPAERTSLERQLAAQRENLRLIEERLAEFVSPADPANLQLVKSQRQTAARIAELERRLGITPP